MIPPYAYWKMLSPIAFAPTGASGYTSAESTQLFIGFIIKPTRIPFRSLWQSSGSDIPDSLADIWLITNLLVVR